MFLELEIMYYSYSFQGSSTLKPLQLQSSCSFTMHCRNSLFSNLRCKDNVVFTTAKLLELSGHYSGDWSEYVDVIGVISEPFALEF